MIRIIADENIPFLKGALEPFAEIEYLAAGEINRKNILNADALIIRTRTHCTSDLLEGTHVRFIGTATIGRDHIDEQYCQTKGITVVSAPGCNAASVDQYMASALAYLHIHKLQLNGKKIGIIGAGNVGSRIIRTARAFGLIPLVNDPPRADREGPAGFAELGMILEEAEVITLHVPVTTEGPYPTFYMVDQHFLKKAQKLEVLINTARGPVVHTSDLLKYMDARNTDLRTILDVWEDEPDISRELLRRSTLGTPHIAGYSADGKANATKVMVRALGRHFDWPLSDWEAGILPRPLQDPVTIDASGKSDIEILAEAALHTYKIEDDSQALKDDPNAFESFRNSYPPRREPPAFSCRVTSANHSAIQLLKEMGFNLLSNMA